MNNALSDEKLKSLQIVIGFNFKNIDLLLEAVCHKSYVYDGNNHALKDNERLEFLGDAILGMIISETLMRQFPAYQEGELSMIKSTLIRRDTLAMLARNIQLGNYLFLSRGEESSGGRDRSSILANAFEALMGAIYLDQGMNRTRYFVLDSFDDLLSRIPQEVHHKEYKNLLQEIAHIKFKAKPRYQIISEDGPDHQKIFEVLVLIQDTVYGKGKGLSKKEAEKQAAKEGYDCIMQNSDERSS